MKPVDPEDIKAVAIGALSIAADLLGLPVMGRVAPVVASLVVRGLELLQSNSPDEAIKLLRIRAEKADLPALRQSLEWEAINGQPREPRGTPRPDEGSQ